MKDDGISSLDAYRLEAERETRICFGGVRYEQRPICEVCGAQGCSVSHPIRSDEPKEAA